MNTYTIYKIHYCNIDESINNERANLAIVMRPIVSFKYNMFKLIMCYEDHICWLSCPKLETAPAI